MSNKNTTAVEVKGKVGRPAKTFSRDQLRAALKGITAKSRVAACVEIGAKLNASWLTVYKAYQAKNVKLPMGKRGRPAKATASATA